MDDLYALGSKIPPLAVVLAFLIPLAIAVYWYGNRQLRGASKTGGRRRYGGRSTSPLDPAFQAQVRRFEERQSFAAIAEAPAGMVMIRGVLAGAEPTLGGAPGRECVWRNRADGRRDMAVASDTVFMRDASGQACLEGLEGAQVIAPREKASHDVEWVGLYLGDEVEVIGRFAPEPAPVGDDPALRVYGSLGGDAKLHVRVARRPPPVQATAEPAPADAGRTRDLENPEPAPAPAPASEEE